jgi:hypothetical protein
MRLLPAVDACISVSSTIAQVASLLDKVVICPGHSNLTPISSSDDPRRLFDILAKSQESCDSSAYWSFYFDRYCFPDHLLDDTAWLEERLLDWISEDASGLNRYKPVLKKRELIKHYGRAFQITDPRINPPSVNPLPVNDVVADIGPSTAELLREISAIRRSWSWRVTAPLRWVVDSMKRRSYRE